MKTKFMLLVLTGLLFSCEQESELTQEIAAPIINEGTATLQNEGVFSPTPGISVKGTAKIFLENDQNKLELFNFSISSGPDLKVYLSKTDSPTEFVNLGNLTSATVYSIPNGVDVKQYPFVLIHCQQYNHLFAVAQLTQK